MKRSAAPTIDLHRIEKIVQAHLGRPGATLPILHDILAEFRYIPDEAITIIAHGLNVTRAEIYGVVSFYADFRTTPPGRHILQICRGESCQAMGSEKLEEHAKDVLGIDYHQTNDDKTITLEPVFCLGNCACSPAVRVGDDILGRVDCERLDSLLDELSRAQPT
jgi:formate dehydrogenase subunit gamma